MFRWSSCQLAPAILHSALNIWHRRYSHLINLIIIQSRTVTFLNLSQGVTVLMPAVLGGAPTRSDGAYGRPDVLIHGSQDLRTSRWRQRMQIGIPRDILKFPGYSAWQGERSEKGPTLGRLTPRYAEVFLQTLRRGPSLHRAFFPRAELGLRVTSCIEAPQAPSHRKVPVVSSPYSLRFAKRS